MNFHSLDQAVFSIKDTILYETVLNALHEVFDRGGDLQPNEDGSVVTVTLSDGTRFQVNTDESSVRFITKKGNQVEVTAPNSDGIRTLYFKVYDEENNGWSFGASFDGADRDGAIFEGVLATVRAYAMFDPKTTGLMFSGLKDKKDYKNDDVIIKQVGDLERALVNKLPHKDFDEQLENGRVLYSMILDILKQIKNSSDEDSQKALDNGLNKIGVWLQNTLENHPGSVDEESFMPEYEALVKLLSSVPKKQLGGRTRRDQAYIKMIKRNDPNGKVVYDGYSYKYQIDPNIVAEKQEKYAKRLQPSFLNW